MRKPRSPANCGASWPALPAATQTQRPGVISAASIQRQIALVPSCACPLVPSEMLTTVGIRRP